MKVKLIDRDERGRLRLSMKALRAEARRACRSEPNGDRVARRGGSRGGRRRASDRGGRGRRSTAQRSRGGEARRGRRGAIAVVEVASRGDRRVVAAAMPGCAAPCLPNGLTVLSEHMPGVRSVAFGAWVRAASLHETPRADGRLAPARAHGVQGHRRAAPRTRSRCRSRRSAARSTRTPSREHTVVSGARARRAPARRPPTSSATSSSGPLLRRADLALERKVMLEEIGMVDDTPDDLVFELHNEALWGAHPYGYSILGTRDTVSALGVRDLRGAARARVPSGAASWSRASGNVEHDAAARRARANRLDGRPARRRDAARRAAAGRAAPPSAGTSSARARRRTSSFGATAVRAQRPAPLRDGARRACCSAAA